MSRIPPSPSRPPSKLRVPVSPAYPRVGSPSKPSASTASPARPRTKSNPQTPSRSLRKPTPEDKPPVPKTQISIKEAIALKRAEAKKAGSSKAFDDLGSLENAIPTKKAEEDVVDELGRLSVVETIERARSTVKAQGSINLASRSLPCLPSALFELHLGVTPDPLKSVPKEPPIGTSSDVGRRGGRREGPSWFEAQDLLIIKAWNNEIIEIQPEISLFGSLKVVDLHSNKLETLPESFSSLSALTTLDLSHNALTSLPHKIFALPNLVTLNISHNGLVSLPFGSPFTERSSHSRQSISGTGSFFAPIVTYASAPLPRLITLDASHNCLSVAEIDVTFPALLSKIDFSANPLGDSQSFILALGNLEKLKELRFATADISNNSFPPDIFTSSPRKPFSSLRLLDLSETKVTAEAIENSFTDQLEQEVSFDYTTEDPSVGVTRVLIGKKVVREPWELEAERKARKRAARTTPDTSGEGTAVPESRSGKGEAAKELWELDAEPGLLTEEGRRRARAAATAAAAPSILPRNEPKEVKVIQKEAWEIEAEQGLLTEGGRRRARAAAAAAEASVGADGVHSLSRKPSASSFSLTNPQYYSEKTSTLTLPPSAPASKGHSRAFSQASSAWPSASLGKMDIALPTPTIPLAIISSQPFAQTLKVLTLTNRRLDVSLTLPPGLENNLLPNLEELNLVGCRLHDTISVSRQQGSISGALTPPRSNEPLLPLLAKLFPGLQTLDLSDNILTSFSADVWSSIILAGASEGNQLPSRKGLKQLRLRGNRLTNLEGLQGLAGSFRGHRAVPEWKLEELDLRDNEIGKLPPELGLLPLDVFLVDGNVFRVPQRRVWEREGTKGLLGWLRGRIE